MGGHSRGRGRGGPRPQHKAKKFRVRRRYRPKVKAEDHIKLVFRDLHKLLAKKKILEAVGKGLTEEYEKKKKDLDEKAAEAAQKALQAKAD